MFEIAKPRLANETEVLERTGYPAGGVPAASGGLGRAWHRNEECGCEKNSSHHFGYFSQRNHLLLQTSSTYNAIILLNMENIRGSSQQAEIYLYNKYRNHYDEEGESRYWKCEG
ncbi:hypothetical protein WJ0W_003835 [Paenibacillus melissococcoides]|uniref:Uncharacterized protein n=1 Tax=Paenibacillus melissococcoides TaxID=2912268 RepID=A0ABM9G5Y1_9BACL|nr:MULTISPECIES: hypothetical protein [Paenibacillus]MEB9895952.1 hypothetical protein [Bacillus cereus]CAH8246601.1 hypothetical protein WJ0W_003835 [Paenibacillus melissococcoides]CAH8715226.1 hypothetical protein HTL2_004204 [Paenibacillus melissococcoides]CAH8716157.1 hypothetical protein WDD9_004471 [Paenibacillus melissococcoides]